MLVDTCRKRGIPVGRDKRDRSRRRTARVCSCAEERGTAKYADHEVG